MNKLIFSGAFCSALLFVAAQSNAGGLAPPVETPVVVAPVAQVSDWYISGFAGASILEDVNTDFVGGPVSVSFNTGYTVGLTVGRRVFQNFRVEGELSYAKYDVDDVAAPTQVGGEGGGSSGASGDLEAIFLMANVWFDIPTQGRISPYIGGGLGVADVNADTLFGGGPSGYQDGGTNFAAQVGAGISVGIGEKMAIDIGYRYKLVPNVDFNDAGGLGRYTNGDLKSHNLQAGLRYSF